MYAQVVRIQLQPGKTDDFADLFQSSVLPLVREREGFKAGYLLVDAEANRAIGFAAYETKEQVESLISSGFFQENVAKLSGTFAAPPEREVYYVAATA